MQEVALRDAFASLAGVPHFKKDGTPPWRTPVLEGQPQPPWSLGAMEITTAVPWHLLSEKSSSNLHLRWRPAYIAGLNGLGETKTVESLLRNDVHQTGPSPLGLKRAAIRIKTEMRRTSLSPSSNFCVVRRTLMINLSRLPTRPKSPEVV